MLRQHSDPQQDLAFCREAIFMEQSHEATQWEDVSKPHMEVQSQDSKPESPDTCLLTDSRQSSQTGIIGREKKEETGHRANLPDILC